MTHTMATTDPATDSQEVLLADQALRGYRDARAENHIELSRKALWAAIYHLTVAVGALDQQIGHRVLPPEPASRKRRSGDRASKAPNGGD